MELYWWNLMIAKVTSFIKRFIIPLFLPNYETSFKFQIKDHSIKTYDQGGSCIFCRMTTKLDELIYQDDLVSAFLDRKSIAVGHIQVIPNRHIDNLLHLLPEDAPLVKHMWEIGTRLLQERHPDATLRFGFHVPPRMSINHLHLHCIALPFTRKVNWSYSNWLWFMSPQECIKMLSHRQAQTKASCSE
jgi:diadenosine tetraphosphate (Ap4A) HIT family hydrolase